MSVSSPLADDSRMRCLLQDPSFRLIKVVHNYDSDIQWPPFEIESLTVVTPALDPEIAEDVYDRGWIVLSHMWGPPSTWISWDDTGVVDAATGEVLPVKVSPNKREEMMGLLRTFDGYWWIDVFCARSDTPLVIMGDVYKHSKSCYALVDSPSVVFYSQTYDTFNIAAAALGDHLEESANAYMDTLIHQSDKELLAQREWSQTLNDVMQWPFKHFDDAVYARLRQLQEVFWVDESVEPLFEGMKGRSASDKEDLARAFFDSQKDAVDKSDQDILLNWLGAWRIDNLHQTLDGIAGVLSCQWMNRVWTLQELAMPLFVLLTSPTTKVNPGQTNIPTTYLVQLQEDLGKAMDVVSKAYEMRCAVTTAAATEADNSLSRLRAPARILEDYRSTDPVLACIYSDYRKFFEIVASLGRIHGSQANTENINRSESLKLYLNSFATSQRKALYPVDYVYGVLGILDIDIPPMDDPQKVWQMFTENIKTRHPDIDVPEVIDLSKATKMEDVYGNFGFPEEENFVSLQAALQLVRFY